MKNLPIEEKLSPEGYHVWPLTRDDLEDAETEIYDAVLPKLTNPSPEQLHMLAAYAFAAGEFKKAFEDKKLANHLRRCMLYARNGLGLWQPVHISSMELILEQQDSWPDVVNHLSQAWQFGEDS